MPQNPDLVGLLPPSLMRGTGNFRANAERLIRELQSAVNTVRTDYVPLAGGTFSGEVQFNADATFINSFGNPGGFIYAYDSSGREILMLESGDSDAISDEARIQIYGSGDTSLPGQLHLYTDLFRVNELDGTLRFQIGGPGEFTSWYWPTGGDYIWLANDADGALHSRFTNLYLRDKASNTTRLAIDGDADVSFYAAGAGSATFQWDESADEWIFWRDLSMRGNTIDDVSLNAVASYSSTVGGTMTLYHPTSGSVFISWSSDYLRYRFGGSSTPAGILISNYDTPTIYLKRGGGLELEGQIEQVVSPDGGKSHIPYWNGDMYLTYDYNSGTGSFVIRNYTGSVYNTRVHLTKDWSYFYTDHGYIQLGPANTSFAHIYTDRSAFYFNKTDIRANGNTMWHAGNDGPGSGLNADMVDGSHSSAFATSGHDHYIGSTTSSPQCWVETGTGNVRISTSRAAAKRDIQPWAVSDTEWSQLEPHSFRSVLPLDDPDRVQRGFVWDRLPDQFRTGESPDIYAILAALVSRVKQLEAR